MTRRFWVHLIRQSAGAAVVAGALVGTGAGVFHIGQAMAGPRRTEMLAAGVDPMQVGTARQVQRAKRIRAERF